MAYSDNGATRDSSSHGERGAQRREVSTSEVSRLLAQIQSEQEAAQNGLTGLASGYARHAFVTARMNRIDALHQELKEMVGNEMAIALLYSTIEACSQSESDMPFS
ncbi:MAG TPA: hypothetical protein VFV38_15880 [Ktedonobacteraceae bacterium]|nr:hypothetical protein [Ktedonobacteraceae bacterium]